MSKNQICYVKFLANYIFQISFKHHLLIPASFQPTFETKFVQNITLACREIKMLAWKWTQVNNLKTNVALNFQDFALEEQR